MNVRPRMRRTHVIVFALIGLLVFSGSLLGRIGVSRAGEILEDNWRGAYDILVTHEDGFERISPGRDANGFSLVDNNYASQTSRVIGFDQLDQINALDSVDLAAPVAFLGRMANAPPWFYFTIEDHNFTEDPVQDYVITWSITDDNGIIFERTNNLRIDATRWTGESGQYFDVGISITNDFAPMDRHLLLVQASVFGDSLLLGWGQGPTVATTIAAVDPVLEQELLGEAGEFLQPLEDFDEFIRQHSQLTPIEAFGETGTEILPELIDMPGVQPGSRPAPFWMYGGQNPLVGYLRNTDAYPPTTITATIEGVGETSVEYDEVMRPFNGGLHDLPWPTNDLDTGEPIIENYTLSNYTGTRLYPPQLTQVDSPVEGQAAFTARMLGIYSPFARIEGADIDLPTGTDPGEEISYRNPTGNQLSIGTYSQEGAAPFEVATFTPGEIVTEGGYVPLGLYGPNTSTHEGEPFPVSRHALGIATQAPSAIVSFEGAKELTSQETIISAVRVRVGGLDGLDNDDALTRINDTAQAIRRIDGLDATVVIGGTTQPVNIWVPLYAFGTDDPLGQQVVDELGWIQVDYGTLGVASWTASLTNETVDRVAVATILISSLFVIGLCLLARQERRTTHALLASQGWSTSQRLRWTLGEEWPGLAVFGVAAAIAFIIAGTDMIRYAILAAVLALLLGLIIANPVHSRRLAPADRLGTRARMLTLAVFEGISLGITAAAIGALGMISLWYFRLLTQTSLGSVMTQALMPVVGAILAAGAVIVLTMAVTARKNREVTSARNDFSYWGLERSQAQIRTRNFAPIAIHVIIASIIVAAGSRYADGYQQGTTLYLALGGCWILISLLTRGISAMRWKPTILEPTPSQ